MPNHAVPTTYRRFLVLLEIIVHESQDQGRLYHVKQLF